MLALIVLISIDQMKPCPCPSFPCYYFLGSVLHRLDLIWRCEGVKSSKWRLRPLLSYPLFVLESLSQFSRTAVDEFTFFRDVHFALFDSSHFLFHSLKCWPFHIIIHLFDL